MARKELADVITITHVNGVEVSPTNSIDDPMPIMGLSVSANGTLTLELTDITVNCVISYPDQNVQTPDDPRSMPAPPQDVPTRWEYSNIGGVLPTLPGEVAELVATLGGPNPVDSDKVFLTISMDPPPA